MSYWRSPRDGDIDIMEIPSISRDVMFFMCGGLVGGLIGFVLSMVG
jgi:hypothetical protein